MAKISKTRTGRSKRKRDPLPPVIKVADLQRSFPQQVSDALDMKRDVTDEIAQSLRSALRHLAAASGTIKGVLKRMKR